MLKKLIAAAAFALFAAPALAGNGAPSGSHYNLNILGKDNCAGDDLEGSNRHTIQVLLNYSDNTYTGMPVASLSKKNKIFLSEGPFQVLDGNACDGDGAAFQLPANPFVCNDTLCTDPTFLEYEVFARALGKPGGQATMTTCASGAGDDLVLGTNDDEIVCSTENVLLVRKTGGSKFSNVTKELTTIYLDTDADGVADTRYGLFDSSFYDYFWDYDNAGLRLAQLRFYPVQ